MGYRTLITFWALSFEKIVELFGPHANYSIISLVPDSEGYKPKRNEMNSCGVRQYHNKLQYDGPVLSITAHKQLVRICLGVKGPLT